MVRIKTPLNLLASMVALLSLAPVLPFLDLPVLGLGLTAIAVGLWCDRQERYPLHGLTSTVAAVAGVLFYAPQISREDVATPVVHALVVLLTVRLLSAKQARDYLQIFLLGLFILAGSSLLSLDIGFIIYLVLMIFAVTIGLVLLTVFVTDHRLVLPRHDLIKTVRVALILPLVSLLLMLVFFMILPRTSHPLWNFLNPASKATTGLSEVVQPGAFAQLSTVRDLAFRAETAELPAEQLYWRALVLNQPQGRQWIRVEPPREGPARPVGGRPISLTIYPEPRQERYLVTLDRPILISGIRFQQADDHVFYARAAVDHRFSFEVTAQPGAALLATGDIPRAFYLTLPESVSQRVRNVATRITAQNPDDSSRLEALEEFFRGQNLVYAQEDLPNGADPVDDFLFGKQRGYCEFFASSYATLARLIGIPTRLVGGYLGGEYNTLGGYYLVTEDTAHVWVEVFTDDLRWTRVDPSQWASNAATVLLNRQASALGALHRLTDAFNYYWIQAVVTFDLGRQMEMLSGAGNTLRDLRQAQPSPTVWSRMAGLGLGVGLIFAGFWWHRRKSGHSTEARLIEDFRARLGRRYGPDAATTQAGLTELAERFNSQPCREFAGIYQAAVFRDRPLTKAEVTRLKNILKKI
jgi:transglutaminase-like putative cysteine protease